MARVIDVVQVKAEIAAEKLAVIIENGSVLLKDMQSGEAVKIATLTPPNGWVSVEEMLPPEHELVLCIVNGKPKPNITLEDAYQLGSWNKADGWIIDEYLDWEDADVSWWMPLPEPPGKEG